jgi:hypothetical protein
MTYATPDAIRVMHPTLMGYGLIQLSGNWLTFYLFRAMNGFSYHILPIIHAYNVGTS